MSINSKKLANMLLIDDSLAEIVLSKAAFRRDHIYLNFSTVQGGEEALRYLSRGSGFEDSPVPDIILLDLNMPDMDGKEVLSYIRQDKSLHDIPVFIYSGSEAEQDIEEAKELGATHYMVKPINYDKLSAAIEHVELLNFFKEGEDNYLICERT